MSSENGAAQQFLHNFGVSHPAWYGCCFLALGVQQAAEGLLIIDNLLSARVPEVWIASGMANRPWSR
jgi:hypothetical protein